MVLGRMIDKLHKMPAVKMQEMALLARFLIWDLGFGGMKYGGEVPAVRKVS